MNCLNPNLSKTILEYLDTGCRKNHSPSYFKIKIYHRNNYFESFREDYLLGKKNDTVEKADDSFEKFLSYYLLEEDRNQFIHYLQEELGYWEDVYTISSDALRKIEENSVTTFYTLEDVIFVIFSSCVICFMVGNND